MALRVRFQYLPGYTLGYSIERLVDGKLYDFADSTFKTGPGATAVAPLTEATYPGRYIATLAATAADQFSDGQYAIGIHDANQMDRLIAFLGAEMYNGDDSPVVAPGGGPDPWAIPLPGAYPAGTAGHILGSNLDAPISTRSTFAGGPVARVVEPVTVGTNNDKTGYAITQAFPANFAALAITANGGVTVGDRSGFSLAASGLDAISVEPGINVRQALAPILAATAGTISGVGTGTISIRGGNATTTRITATIDPAGNRASVVLALPA